VARNDEQLREVIGCVRDGEAASWRLVQELVDIESPSDHKAGVDRVGAVLADRWAELGFSVSRIEERAFGDQLVFDRDGAPGRPRLLLMGHMDTVYPVGRGQSFRRGDDGRAYGSGVIDMKSGLVTMLAAVAALDAAVPPNGRPAIRVFLNSDEEPGSPRSRLAMADVVRGVDGAFVLEPAEPDGSLVLERKGVGIVRIEFVGRSAHAGQEPEKGRDANEALARVLLEAKGLADTATGTTVNPGVIRGGTVPYAISERAVLELDLRVTSPSEQARVEATLETIVETEFVVGVSASASGGFHRPPMVRLPGVERMLTAYRAAAAVAGFTPVEGKSGAASDGNDLVALGIPVMDGVGPVGGGAHSPNEYLEVDSLVPRSAALAGALCLLAAASDEASDASGG
jgi:glutamate carboxypeptidase